jgi:hypothetical protein
MRVPLLAAISRSIADGLSTHPNKHIRLVPGRCTNRSRRGNTPRQSAPIPPAHVRSSYRGRGRWKEGVVGSATLSADLRSPPGRAFKTAEPVSVHNLPPHPFIIERAYPDGWSSLGSAGGGQH